MKSRFPIALLMLLTACCLLGKGRYNFEYPHRFPNAFRLCYVDSHGVTAWALSNGGALSERSSLGVSCPDPTALHADIEWVVMTVEADAEATRGVNLFYVDAGVDCGGVMSATGCAWGKRALIWVRGERETRRTTRHELAHLFWFAKGLTDGGEGQPSALWRLVVDGPPAKPAGAP